MVIAALLAVLLDASHVQERVDSDFVGYYMNFLTYARSYGVNLPSKGLTIHFGKTGRPKDPRRSTIAECSIRRAEVVVDKTWWISFHESERENVMFHELGHCLLRREHRNDMVKNHPLSIMHESSVDNSQYERFKGYYLKELFLYGKENVDLPSGF